MPADQGILDSVTNDNLKTVAGQPAVLSNISLQNLIAHQARVFAIAEAALGNITRRMSELDPSEAASILKTTQGDLAAQIGALAAAISGSQQLTKGAQTTPPPTA
jgi:ABC-type transporter Mla subunit MlaD